MKNDSLTRPEPWRPDSVALTLDRGGSSGPTIPIQPPVVLFVGVVHRQMRTSTAKLATHLAQAHGPTLNHQQERMPTAEPESDSPGFAGASILPVNIEMRRHTGSRAARSFSVGLAQLSKILTDRMCST